MARGVSSFYSTKQSLSSLSSADAEYIEASSAVRELNWVHNVLNEVGSHRGRKTDLHVDNQVAIRIIES